MQMAYDSAGSFVVDQDAGITHCIGNGGCSIGDNWQIERHCLYQWNTEALVFAQRYIGVSGSIMTHQLVVGNRAGENDPISYAKLTDFSVHLRLILAAVFPMSDQDDL